MTDTGTCQWTYDDIHDIWQTGCDEMWCLADMYSHGPLGPGSEY